MQLALTPLCPDLLVRLVLPGLQAQEQQEQQDPLGLQDPQDPQDQKAVPLDLPALQGQSDLPVQRELQVQAEDLEL